MKKTILSLICFLLGSVAMAHPFSKDEYSLRTAVRISDKGITPLVALEVPFAKALEEIDAKPDESKKVKLKKIEKYTKKQWEILAENLTFTIDGKKVKGKWQAIKHPANGKGAEGFFVYLVSFKAKKKILPTDGSVIVIENQAYPDVPMVYTGSAKAIEPWVIVTSTPKTILGEHEAKDLADPDRWSTDAGLRKMEITIKKP